jgi:hypothetical protein
LVASSHTIATFTFSPNHPLYFPHFLHILDGMVIHQLLPVPSSMSRARSGVKSTQRNVCPKLTVLTHTMSLVQSNVGPACTFLHRISSKFECLDYSSTWAPISSILY